MLLSFSAIANPRLPAGRALLLPLCPERLRAGGAVGEEDEDAAGVDPLLPLKCHPGGWDGALHGRVLLGETVVALNWTGGKLKKNPIDVFQCGYCR